MDKRNQKNKIIDKTFYSIINFLSDNEVILIGYIRRGGMNVENHQKIIGSK